MQLQRLAISAATLFATPKPSLHSLIPQRRVRVTPVKCKAMEKTIKMKKVAFQGKPGAYSELACIEVFPELNRNPCELFEDTFHVESFVSDDE